jgi:hypothetical protein
MTEHEQCTYASDLNLGHIRKYILIVNIFARLWPMVAHSQTQ